MIINKLYPSWLDDSNERQQIFSENVPGLANFHLFIFNYDFQMTLVGEYSKQIDVLRQMKEKGLLSDEEMNLEVNIFCKTVDRITELLIPERTNLYEFIPFDGEYVLMFVVVNLFFSFIFV